MRSPRFEPLSKPIQEEDSRMPVLQRPTVGFWEGVVFYGLPRQRGQGSATDEGIAR
jgi:hypothetical protein